MLGFGNGEAPQAATDPRGGEPAPRSHSVMHRWFHPLCGAAPDTLVRALLRGGVSPSRFHVVAIAAAMSLARLPFTVGEALVARGFEHRDRARAMPAPIFVVGHWRSGTTHLTNLLSRFPAFGILSPVSVGLPLEARSFGRLMRPIVEPFLPPTRLIDAMPLQSGMPQEDELALANLSTLSCNHGLYFPSRLATEFRRGIFLDGVDEAELALWQRRMARYLGKMTRAAGGRRLLVRNPVDSARIPILRAIWPDASFVHIHRDPVDVCASSTRMFATLLHELALSPVPDAGLRAKALVREIYPRLMRSLHRDTATLPDRHHVEIRYDDLRTDPLGELDRIHDAFGLAGFASGREAVRAAIEQTGSHLPSVADRGAPAHAWLAGHPDIFACWGYQPIAPARRSMPDPGPEPGRTGAPCTRPAVTASL